MDNAADRALDEIDEVLKKYGIGTFLVVMRDPDNTDEALRAGGNKAWLLGQTVILGDKIVRYWNDECQLDGDHKWKPEGGM